MILKWCWNPFELVICKWWTLLELTKGITKRCRWDPPKMDFSVKIILSILSDFVWPEKLTHKKSWAILKNLYSFMIKLTKTPILPNCQVPNVFLNECNFCHSGIKFLQNCSAFFCVNFSGQRKSEKIERIIFTETSSPSSEFIYLGNFSHYFKELMVPILMLLLLRK